jgi:hypothetical protein
MMVFTRDYSGSEILGELRDTEDPGQTFLKNGMRAITGSKLSNLEKVSLPIREMVSSG